MFLAGIVVFRVFFAVLYVCKWKWRYNFNDAYKVEEYNLEKTFRKLRNKTGEDDDGFSSDDQEIYETAKRMCRDFENDALHKNGM